MNIEKELQRLNEILPLTKRQRDLDPELQEIHRAILRSFAERGKPLDRSEIGPMLTGRSAVEALAALAHKDLVVWETGSDAPRGAYPFTMNETLHTVAVHGREVHAMCAVDALSVSPMFGAEVRIDSSCFATGTPIRIRQRGREILEASPSDIHVGVRWQSAKCCAADSLCTEMAFFRDRETAIEWQGGDLEDKSVYTLDEAVELGAGFFVPLVEEKEAALVG